MIAYTMLGTNDKDRALAFYDALFEGTCIKLCAFRLGAA